MIRDQNGDRQPVGTAPQGGAGESLDLGLHIAVDGQRQAGRVGVVAHHPIAEVRRKRGERQTLTRAGIALRGTGGIVADHPVAGHAGQHAVPRGDGGKGRAVGASRLGRLRQCDQQGGLGRSQTQRLLAEVGQGRGAQPFEVAAHGREVKVEPQHPRLAQPPFQRKRQPDLTQLARPCPGATVFQQARGLHGQGRAARDDASGPQGLPRGAQHRTRIDAGMGVEPLVLIGFQHREVERIDRLRRQGQPPAPVVHGIGPQQGAIAVAHLCRGLQHQRRHLGRVNPDVDAVPRQRRAPEAQRQGDQPAGHSLTVTRPAAVRAR